MPTEGQIAVSPDGSQTAVFTGGQWVVQPTAPAGGVFTLPPDPIEQARLGLSQQSAAATQQDRAADNARADALLPYQQRKAAADAIVAERQATQAARPGANLTPVARGEAIQAFKDADALERAANEIEQLYRTGPGATSGLAGLQDYLPTDANRVFDDAGQRARGYVKRALGFTGGEGNTVSESSALYNPFLPTASDRDEQIVAKIAALRQLANDARGKSALTLGGRPDEQGNIVPLGGSTAGAGTGGGGDDPNALTANRFVNGGGPGAAGFGATSGGGGDIPPAMQAEYQAGLAGVMRNGRFDPQAYAQFRTALDEKYGFPGTGFDTHLQWAEATNQRLAQGGAAIGDQIPAAERDLTSTEQFRNNLVSNPLGAAVAGAADAGSFGTVSALAPEAMAALSEEQFPATMAGQIAGSIGGVSAIARASRALAGRAAPQLLGGGAGAQFGRNLAADAAYGAAYGANTQGDPLSGALLAGAGSAGGQVAGRALGGLVGGGRLSQAAEALRARGVPLTVGQQMTGQGRIGEFVKRAEEAATSIPFVGGMIGARRQEGIEAFNRAAMALAGEPAGTPVTAVGAEGIEQLRAGVQAQYGRALDPVNIDVTGDTAALADITGAQLRAQAIPQVGQEAADAIAFRVDGGLSPAGQMTGRDFQEAYRGLGRDGRAGTGTGAYEAEVAGVMREGQDALAGALERQNPGAFDQFLRANQSNRRLEVVADAVGRAKNQDAQLFTPAQLNAADDISARRLTGRVNASAGNRPFAELAQQGQAVLPSKLPNSGTADRLLHQSLLAGGLLGGSAGVDAYAGTGITPYAAALIALGTAGGTRTGQNLAGAIINQRPAAVRALGEGINRRRGLFGSAAIPLVLAGQ